MGPDPWFASVGQEHHGPQDLGKCLCTEAELDQTHNCGRLSDLRGWIYTEQAVRKQTSHSSYSVSTRHTD